MRRQQQKLIESSAQLRCKRRLLPSKSRRTLPPGLLQMATNQPEGRMEIQTCQRWVTADLL